MERYLKQLLMDIAYATENVSWPYVKQEMSIHDWVPTRMLEEWTGISKVQLPPSGLLSDDQVSRLLNALIKMLNAYNWVFVLQNEVPDRIQYATIRDNFCQEAKVKQWNMGFFQLCKPGTEHGKCSLGDYCQCRFFEELFAGFSDEELSPEEERAMQFECEISHIKRKYGKNWMKYYPYHLDPDWDDENGKPYNYGFDIEDYDEDDDEDDDNWWRR